MISVEWYNTENKDAHNMLVFGRVIKTLGGVSMSKSISGIYKIVNKSNGNYYLGSSVDICRRWKQHEHKLRKGAHPSKHLQSAWNKYGKECFDFIVVEVVDNPSMLISVEQRYLDQDFPVYNTNKVAGNLLGFRFTEAAKKMMAAIHTGFRHTEESKNKMSEYWKGRPRGQHTEERKAKIASSHKGKAINENQKSALSLGRSLPMTEEKKRKISESQKGYKPSEETIEKLKQAWIRRKARQKDG